MIEALPEYEFFFPEPLNPDSFKYRLETLADESPNESREIREAFFNFCVNVAYLNLTVEDGQKEKNFIMLVHSTRKIIQHEDGNRTNSSLLERGKTNYSFPRRGRTKCLLQEVGRPNYPIVERGRPKYPHPRFSRPR